MGGMRVPGRLERTENLLRERLGSALVRACPELPFTVNELTMRFGRTQDAPGVLWRRIDSAIFNAVYAATQGTMLVQLDDGRAARITSEGVRDLSDRLLSLSYDQKAATPALRDALFDLSREGSYAAMRELLSRFELEPSERAFIEQILAENEQEDPASSHA